MTGKTRPIPPLRRGEALHDLFREVFALHGVLSGIMDAVHERAGLRTPHVKAAGVLDAGGPATVPDMAASLGVSRQFVQVVCNELRDAGLVEFLENPRHKTSKLVRLTEAGRTRLALAREREAAIIEEALPDVDVMTVDRTRELLEGIRRAIGSRAHALDVESAVSAVSPSRHCPAGKTPHGYPSHAAANSS